MNNPELKEKLARALQPEQGSTQDFANKLAEAEAAAQKAQFQAQDAQNRADQAEKDLIETNSDNSIELEEQLTEAKLKLSKANEKLGIALSKLERLENQRSDSLIPASMDELLKELSPEEIAELETLMAKSPDLLEALKRQAAEEARRSRNIKENVKFQNQESSSGIPGYTITTWFEFENSTDVETASRVCSLARPNERGGGVDSFPIAKQSGSDREVRTAGLTADLTDRSITEDQLRLALPKCVWRKD